jgi:hypothetical protein
VGCILYRGKSDLKCRLRMKRMDSCLEVYLRRGILVVESRDNRHQRQTKQMSQPGSRNHQPPERSQKVIKVTKYTWLAIQTCYPVTQSRLEALILHFEEPVDKIPASAAYEPTLHKSVDYRAFRLQITTEGIIEIFAQ